MSDCCLLFVTIPTALADDFSQDLIRNKLAACVNIIDDARSVYFWQGRLEQDNESLLLIKLKTDSMAATISLIENKHPYDVPEIIALPIIGGSKAYLDWVKENS